METPEGLRRCDCAEGQRLSAKPVAHAPALTSQQTTIFVEMLAAIPFFPSEGGARTKIGDELRSMCAGPHEALWLVTRMSRLYSRWPGPLEMRRVYCSKHTPWDAVMPIGISEVYPDGVPSERQQMPAIEAPSPKALPAGHVATADTRLENATLSVAEIKKMPTGKIRGSRAEKFDKVLCEVLTPPSERPEIKPTPQVITQSDIDRVVAENRAKSTQEVK